MKHESQHPELIPTGKGKPFKKSISLGALGLGKLWRRRSVTITEYDPCYKVVYLGNVLTGIAKGELCVEKPLCSLWKNYTCNQKPDVHMKLTVTQSGLKAFTKEHGLTEYWSHRVTYCLASPQFPRIFCWVYRHEGRKLKQELRCHAVVCSKDSVAKQIAGQLQNRLAQALNEFKRDKISRQNARLSLANSVYENPSLPRRKILLSTGSHNYRPPLERSKSAPRLMSIEESLEEDDELLAECPASRNRCRAENRLRTGTLRNRLGGLYGGFRDIGTAAAAVNAAAATDETTTGGAIAVVAAVNTECEIENRLAESLQLRDDCCTAAAAGDADTVKLQSVVADSSLPSYRDMVAEGQELLSESSASSVLGEQKKQKRPLLPKYNEVIVECPQGPEDVCYKYNSLVRDRKKLFETIGGDAAATGGRRNHFKRMSSNPEMIGPHNNLVKNRKLLFEGSCRDEEDEDEDLDDLDEDKDCGYPDDESTPSLQSISSGGSDVCKKIAVDLDSLSEEDSDESGYVEAPPPSLCPADVDEKELHKHSSSSSSGNHVAVRNVIAHRVGA
ncbi:uncharacterized protein LOC112686007 [Sipha flava]|uniref:Uncharacterized protein LOC112686007 n=1 Tax=Sipha flava TaxID=143950 RepID=A0A8B8FSY4_9HEMI|nr:uncharacterized protein LOC112686007 [Sipha flava]